MVGKDHLILEHIGAPETRLQAIHDGRVRAVTVMEPFISLALKQGAHIIALTFYRGAEIISADLLPVHRERYFDVLDAATDLINQDFGRYARYVTAVTHGALEPHELDDRFVRYSHVQRYAPELFEPAYAWMKERGFTSGGNDHTSLVIS